MVGWLYGFVELASDWGSGMLVLRGCFRWLLHLFAAFYGKKVENKSERVFGIVHVCAYNYGTWVAGLACKVIQSLQIICTRLGSTLGVCFCPKMPLKLFYGLVFVMTLDYYVHCDIYVKCCRQAKMDSSVESVLRNGFSGGGLLLGG